MIAIETLYPEYNPKMESPCVNLQPDSPIYPHGGRPYYIFFLSCHIEGMFLSGNNAEL